MDSQSFRRAMRIIATWAVLVPLLGCGLFDDAAVETDQPATSAPAVAAPEPAAEPAAGGGACSRIAACCRAYIDAMGGAAPASTCDAYNNVQGMPEAACNSAMAGYRSGLTAMNKAVPSECN